MGLVAPLGTFARRACRTRSVDSKVARLPAGCQPRSGRMATSDCRAGGLSAAPARTLVILDPRLAAASRCCINRTWV